MTRISWSNVNTSSFILVCCIIIFVLVFAVQVLKTILTESVSHRLSTRSERTEDISVTQVAWWKPIELQRCVDTSTSRTKILFALCFPHWKPMGKERGKWRWRSRVRIPPRTFLFSYSVERDRLCSKLEIDNYRVFDPDRRPMYSGLRDF